MRKIKQGFEFEKNISEARGYTSFGIIDYEELNLAIIEGRKKIDSDRDCNSWEDYKIDRSGYDG